MHINDQSEKWHIKSTILCAKECIKFFGWSDYYMFLNEKGPEWIAKETKFNAASDVAYIVGKMQCLN